MVKYCSECDKIYYDEYNYCPMCSAKLREIDGDFLEIKRLIKGYCNSDKKIFKIDEENKLVRFKWDDDWLSFSFEDIIESYNINTEPYQVAGVIDICCAKKEFDNILKKDFPEFEKKLTYKEVENCINYAHAMSCGYAEIIKMNYIL